MDSGNSRLATVARNAPCPCGSGRRFKHCCGAAGTTAPPARYAALAAHRAGLFERAEGLYRRALEDNPDDIDSLHMLGVVQFERMRYREALEVLWDAAERTAWAIPAIRHNLGLVLGKLMARDANARQADLLERFAAFERARKAGTTNVSPLVTVVVPAYNHARFVGQAIASVAAQTYPNLELVVIDDGSGDGTPAVVEAALEGLTIPARLIARENRGAPATLNEGAALARGAYLAFLNSDDWYAPERIACMVEEVARTGGRWGFSLISGGDDETANGRPEDARILDIKRRQRDLLGTTPNSFTLVEFNVAASTGNLFVERDFFHALGGFRDYRYNHDWDFCLRAASVAEPVVVPRPLYFYRIHENNTIAESQDRATDDANRVFTDFFAATLADGTAGHNELGPSAPGNRELLLKAACLGSKGALIPVDSLRRLAAGWRTNERPRASSGAVAPAAGAPRKPAIVVLGMHRSGTSALARVLNLCGAFLPTRIIPPKLGANPKGFWEPEAVVDLNVRLMRQLRGEWDRVDAMLPWDAEVAAEFERDARALLASEYGDAQPILIKDPRIGVLVPLWNDALLGAGYRPVYVVTVRNPVEVAQSLLARDDMSLGDGLALWLAYSRKIAEFTQSQRDVVHVRYVDLVDDWRAVVHRVAEQLDVPLDPAPRAGEVDRFLERSLRRQAADDDAVDALSLAPPMAAELRALYRSSLARCGCAVPEVDASPAATARNA